LSPAWLIARKYFPTEESHFSEARCRRGPALTAHGAIAIYWNGLLLRVASGHAPRASLFYDSCGQAVFYLEFAHFRFQLGGIEKKKLSKKKSDNTLSKRKK
jgi:hypothetical protein